VKLLDTSVAIDHLRGDQNAVALLTMLIERDEILAASEVVRFDVVGGVHDRRGCRPGAVLRRRSLGC
jgi:predicted nucleic acid-binding protein